MAAVGFDFTHGRLDTSLHPFCGGVPDEVRITTRYDEADFAKALMGVLHETGHALYERGLPGDWRAQPVGAARGMAVHESQSLLIEMQACRSAEFAAYLAPLAREAFAGKGPAWTADNLLRLNNRVSPGFIRVDADEVTYPAHIILRYRLEKNIIAGDLPLADLPGAWNEGMQALLGITPPDDRHGCLQDIHWFDGAWGYFPTYTLGAIAAAQLFAAATAAIPEIPAAIGRGDFAPLIGWLRQNVHAWGSFHSTDALLEQATGRPLDPKAFEAHLTARYLG
jgi:carboxypeptidase Taq